MTNSRYFDYSREMTKHGAIEIISKTELSQRLGRSLSTISRMIADGRLPQPLRTPHGNVSGWLSTTIEQWVKENG